MKDIYYEDILLARFDKLLAKQDFDLTPEESEELETLSAWYESWLDYLEALEDIRRWYERHDQH